MTDLDKTLNMLKSQKADTRYDACEELRVASESSPEVILALEEATQDEDEEVAERASKALTSEVHLQMGVKMGRYWAISEVKPEPQTKPEPLKVERIDGNHWKISGTESGWILRVHFDTKFKALLALRIYQEGGSEYDYYIALKKSDNDFDF